VEEASKLRPRFAIFPAMVTDNILVIDARERLDAVSTRRAVGAVDRRHVKSVAARA